MQTNTDKAFRCWQYRSGIGTCDTFKLFSFSVFLSIHEHQFAHPPKNFSGAKLFRANDVISIEYVLCSQQELPCALACFLVEFDLLFAFVVLSCLILDSASLFIYVHEHDRLCFPMSETAVFYCICWLSSSRDRKGQSGRILFGIGGRVLWVRDP